MRTLICLLSLLTHAVCGEVLVQSDFENDEPNPAPRRQAGTNPGGWEVHGEVPDPGKLVDASIEATGSPMNGGGQSLLIVDRAADKARLEVKRALAAPVKGAVTLTFDVRVNERLTDGDLLVTTLYTTDENPATGCKLSSPPGDLRIYVQSPTGGLLRNESGPAVIAVATWYRMFLTAPAPASDQPATLTLITGTSTNSYPLARTPAGTDAGYHRVQFTTGLGGAGQADVNLDSITLATP